MRNLVCLYCLTTIAALGQPVDITNLLQSVERHYPSILAALKDKEAAEGKARAAQGAFDLRLKFNTRNDPLGFYETRVIEALIEQPTRYRGAKFFGGWRRGDGLFPLQEEKRETQSGGEVLFGVSAPVLRDSSIDAARAGLRQTGLAVEAEQARVDRVRLLVQQSATAQFLQWRAAAQRRKVREAILELALVRDQGIRDQVAIGDKAQVDIIDNQRIIATRRESVLAAKQKAQQEAIKLSLYWRDAAGRPQVPESTNGVECLDKTLLGESPALGEALARHPETQIFDRVLRAERVGRELSQNQLLPRLDLTMSVSKDLGRGSSTKEATELRIGAFFDYPFQNRNARGGLSSAQAKIASLEQKLTLLTDQLRAAAAIARSNIEQTRNRIARLTERLSLARQMRQAEADRVALQLSDLLRLNLREQDVAAAETDLIAARLELRLAELDWINALAIDLAPSSQSNP